jgi:hypothetical protein
MNVFTSGAVSRNGTRPIWSDSLPKKGLVTRENREKGMEEMTCRKLD